MELADDDLETIGQSWNRKAGRAGSSPVDTMGLRRVSFYQLGERPMLKLFDLIADTEYELKVKMTQLRDDSIVQPAYEVTLYHRATTCYCNFKIAIAEVDRLSEADLVMLYFDPAMRMMERGIAQAAEEEKVA